MKKIILLCSCLIITAFTLTACGSDNNPESTGTTTEDNSNNSNEDNTVDTDGNSDNTDDSGDSLGDDVGDVIEDVGDAVDDVAEDVADGISGSYDTYDEAYDYFMGQISDTSGKYEVRNSDKDLTEYTSGSQGYHFELHDSTKSSDSKIGDFYVDSESGKVYKANDNDGVSEFDFSDL